MQAQDAEATTITIDLGKNKLHIAKDPLHFGFWGLSLDRGALPTEFRGKYTDRRSAQQAADLYVRTKKTPKE